MRGGGAEGFIEYHYLKKSFEFSSILTNPEIHAFRLVAYGNKMKEEDLEVGLRNFQLTETELQYTKEEARAAAEKLVFGPDYMNLKKEIARKVESSANTILTNTLQKCENSEAEISEIFEILKKLLIVVLILELLSILIVVDEGEAKKK